MSFNRMLLVVCAGLFVSTANHALDAAPLTFTQQVLADSPLAFWQLNDANKASGATAVSTVNPGTYNGTYQWGNQAGNSITSIPAAYPNLGTAADFHNTTLNTSLASSDTVVAPNTGFPIGGADRTMIFWAQTTTPTDGLYHAATDYGTPGTFNADFGTAVFAGTDTNSPKGGMGISQWGDGTGTTSVINDGSWHFFAVTVTGGGNYEVYFDGALQNSKTMTTATALGIATYIGASNAVNGAEIGWNGGIGDVAVFNHALTGAQISTLFQAAPVPEPASLALLGLASLGLLIAARRRKA